MKIINIENIKEFYRLLDHKNQTEIRGFYLDENLKPSKKDCERKWVSTEKEFIEFCKKHNGKCNLYAGLNERKKGGGFAKDVLSVKNIFIDIDARKKPATKEDLIEVSKFTNNIVSGLKRNYKAEPTIINSGNGYQLLYKIPKIEIADENRDEVQIKIQQFISNLKEKYDDDKTKLDQVGDLPRIMKITGTQNIKGWRVSEFIEISKKENKELKEYILEIKPNIFEKKKIKNKKEDIELNKRFYEILEKDDKIKNLYDGKFEKYSDSSFGGELSLVRMLIEYGFDKKEIFNIMANCKIERWGERGIGYRNETYKRALAKISEEKSKDLIVNQVISLLLQKKRNEATELMTNYIIEKHNIYTTRHDSKSEMWIYQEGVYLPKGRSYVKEIVRECTKEAFTTHLCNEVLNKIEADTFIEQEELFKEENSNEICLENGILNIETLKLIEFNPNKRFFSKFPIEYNAEKKCPKINKFFKEILNEDDKVILIKEIFGRILTKEYKPKRAVMFYNTGDGAKSTIQTLIKIFVGEENTSSISLSRMNDVDFSIDDLHKKHANLSGEISNTDLKDTSTFKMLTGGDLISAKRKFLSDLKFINHSLLIFACNELPKVYDTSLGFWSRWILVEFPNIFLKKTEYDLSKSTNKKIADEDILKKICSKEEMSGLLNESIDGLKRLKENKDFTYTRNSKEVMEAWMRTADSFLAYCTDNICEAWESKIKKSDLRFMYRKYCKDHKVKSVSDISIKITLQELFGASDERLWNEETRKQDNVWVGIKQKEDRIIQKKI